MKALVFYGPGDVRYVDVETPEPRQGEVLIRVKAVSICGSDLSGYKGKSPFRVPPLIMGHEFSGEIAKLGEGVTGINVGDRVIVETNLYCGECPNCKAGFVNICENRKIIGTTMKAGSYNGGMAEYVVAPANKVIKLPENVSFNAAALIEPLANVLHAIKHVGSLEGKNVAVYGAGPIGLLTIMSAKYYGAGKVFAMEILENRLEMAKECGADVVINPAKEKASEIVKKMTDGAGADVVFDAVGFAETVRDSAEMVRNGGTVVWIGLGANTVEIEYKMAVARELGFKGTYMYITEMVEGVEILAKGGMNVEKIITGVYPLSEGPRIFEELASGKSKDIKVILYP
ncbi:MAG: galactitol-1-phosphate 5-dehydrogenase [Synergistetes bacterium]|nr:galactitol-1-phosphate 5-dehydrogenase [Synergistota bacterium]MDK2870874.1 L-iditol 2-dehydrogenase [bacterium]